MSDESFDVLIVGAGIVGLTQALASAEQRWRVAVIDRVKLTAECRDDFDSRVYAINHESQTLWTRLGVWPLLSRKTPYRQMQVWDQLGGGEIRFFAEEIAKTALGHIIEDHVIKAALIQKLKDYPNVHVFTEEKLTSLVPTEKGISLIGSRLFHAPLLIGADGAQSWVREQVGIALDAQPCGQTALVCTVRTEKPHENAARQAFTPTGPVALLPLFDPHTTSLVWSADSDYADTLLQMNDDDFSQALTTIFSDKLGRVVHVSARHPFVLTQRQAKAYVAPNVALIGDAAHTLHPLAGLGMNLGLGDVALLTEILGAPCQPSLSRLQRYETERKGESAALLATMRGLQQLFGGQNRSKAALRSFGLQLAHHFTPLKRFFMHQAGA